MISSPSTSSPRNVQSPQRINIPSGIGRSSSIERQTQFHEGSTSGLSLEERLAHAAQRVADCVNKSDMASFSKAMEELDKLRNEASQLMQQ